MHLDKAAYEQSNYLPQHEKLTEQIAEITKEYDRALLHKSAIDQGNPSPRCSYAVATV